MSCFEPRLQRHASPRRASLKKNCVAQDSFDTRDVRQPIALACHCITIGIDSNCCISVELPPAQRLVEPYTRQRRDRRLHSRSKHRDMGAELAKPFYQRSRSDIAPAS
jgi:hypothetical protein